MTNKLPTEAYEYYIAIGPKRSYSAVAKRYGVSKRSVTKRARRDKWQDRVIAFNAAAANAEQQPETLAVESRQAERVHLIQEAMHEVLTPVRVKALFASLFQRAVKDNDVGAARLLLDRVLGRLRNESLPATSIDLPDGLECAADIKRAANALLQGVTDGSISPEDARTAANVVEAARKAIETDDLEKRIAALEESVKKEQDP